MAAFSPPLSVKVWSSERELVFSAFEDVISWAEAEEGRWAAFRAPQLPRLAKVLQQQRSTLASVRGLANQGKRAEIEAALVGIKTGTFIVSDSPGFPVLEYVGSRDGDAGMLGVISSRADGQSLVQQSGVSLDVATRFAILAGPLSLEAKRQLAEDTGADLLRLKNQFDSAVASMRTAADKLEGQIAAEQSSFTEAQGQRQQEWQGLTQGIGDDWTKLKAVYDTELGLRAPTAYWTERAGTHRNQAIAYAIAFAAALGAFVRIFSGEGLKYLNSVPPDASPVIAVLPVLIPAFVGVWVLRIIGRLLSESVQLMRDARERETLVKTFLALMKDDVAGKAVVKDEDRILILHALFRASAVTATDDSPPVHWFEAIAGRNRK